MSWDSVTRRQPGRRRVRGLSWAPQFWLMVGVLMPAATALLTPDRALAEGNRPELARAGTDRLAAAGSAAVAGREPRGKAEEPSPRAVTPRAKRLAPLVSPSPEQIRALERLRIHQPVDDEQGAAGQQEPQQRLAQHAREPRPPRRLHQFGCFGPAGSASLPALSPRRCSSTGWLITS